MSTDHTPSALHDLTIAEASRLIKARKLSPVELTRALLDRTEALEPQINAFITRLPEAAMEAAKAAEAEIMRGIIKSPLHGVPFAVKDIYDTAGVLTSGHSRTCIDRVPAKDATTVAKLRAAGGVLTGKLATHEFAHGGPSFDLPWPTARNPWNRDHATGGSSSGSGAAGAAGLTMGSLGSDTGGSIRNPAAFCGLVGLKPTYGLVSRFGVYTNSFSYDHAGPLTWTAEDCAIMLQTIAGHDAKDPSSVNRDIPPFRDALIGSVKGLRIGIIRHLYENDVATPPVVKQALESAYDVLRGLGAVLEDVVIRPAQQYHDVKITGAESELYAVHEPALRTQLNQFGEDFLGRTLGALLISSADYMQASRQRRKMIADMQPLYAKYDAFLTAGPGPAGRLDAWRTIDFWRKASLTTPFNVLGGPALAQCIGYSDDGLPLSMQIYARPFADATVLRVAHAYEKATPWRARRPVLDASATFHPGQPPVPDPENATIGGARRDEIAALCKRAGLTLNDRHFEQLCATAPYIDEMTARLERDPAFHDEPSSIFIA